MVNREVWVIICSWWYHWNVPLSVWSFLLCHPSHHLQGFGHPLISTLLLRTRWGCCFYPTLGRGQLRGCLWWIYVVIRGSHFYSSPHSAWERGMGFLHFIVFSIASPLPSRAPASKPHCPSFCCGESLLIPGAANLVFTQSRLCTNLLYCCCPSILSIFLWELDFWRNQRKCLALLFRYYHLFPEAISSQLKASGTRRNGNRKLDFLWNSFASALVEIMTKARRS